MAEPLAADVDRADDGGRRHDGGRHGEPSERQPGVSGRWDAIVVAGGQARRMGGIDKVAVEVAGRTLLDRVLDAVAEAGTTVVVGPPRPVAGGHDVRWALEQPPGSGPVAALAAGMAHVTAPRVVVLAADLPFVGPEHIRLLLEATTTTSTTTTTTDTTSADTTATETRSGPAVAAATLVDPDGRVQPLAAAWWSHELRAALPALPAGAAMRSLLVGRQVAAVPADAVTCHDCDSPQALAWARTQAGTMAG